MYYNQNPFLNPQFPNYGSSQVQQQIRQEIVKVNGRNGAEAYQLQPNSSILLLDESMPIVWLKTTDGAGYPTLTPYSITPYQPEPQVDLKSLESRISHLEEVINAKSESNASEVKSREQYNNKQQSRSN